MPAMDTLILSFSNLRSLPALSSYRIRGLQASNNKILALWDENMPQGIEEIDLQDNCINSDGLLVAWPPTLKIINLARNPLRSLDFTELWPNALRELDLSFTHLRTLDCRPLPHTLQTLKLSFTDIESIHVLPEGLLHIEANHTPLSYLPRRMPNGLQRAEFAHTSLRSTGLPTFWGTHLRSLLLSRTNLTQWPKGLPSSLEVLNLSRNRLQEICTESQFPEALCILNLTMNNIRVIPSWASKKRKTLWILTDNCLIGDLPIPDHQILDAADQWDQPLHSASADCIQRSWRLARLRRRLKAWRRMAILKEDLLALAMCPDRAGKFEPISEGWRVEGREGL